jgi:hypothetical protein
MIFGILDVIVWYAIVMRTKIVAMTRKAEMEFFKPIMCSTPYRAKAEMLRIEDRDIISTAWIEDSAGEVYARLNAVFREARGLAMDAFIDRFDFSNNDAGDKGILPVAPGNRSRSLNRLSARRWRP